MYFPVMNPLLFLAIVFILWILNELHVEIKSQTKPTNISAESKRNNQLLVGGTALSVLIMAFFLFLNVKVSSFGMVLDANFTYLSYIGSFLALLGVILRRVAINTLKHNFDGVIQIKKEQVLMKSGMYNYVRHPSYTGSILTFIGFGIASMNVISFIVLTVFIFTIYHARIQIEEKVLQDAFKEAYIQYKNETPAFFPNLLKTKKSGVK